jgi:regulator of sigma E protease
MIPALQSLPDPFVRAFTLILALFPLVLFHELGHFVVAKLNKIRVEEFGIGFPPRLVRIFSAGGTDYTLNWLPIGGFVRLAGEDDPDVPDSFASKSKRARAAVLLAGPCANFLLAALIFIIVAVPEQTPAVHGVSVAGFATVGATATSPARDAGLKPYDIIVAVNGKPLVDAAAATTATDDGSAVVTALQKAANDFTGRTMQLTVLRGLSAAPVTRPASGLKTVPSDVPGLVGDKVVAAPAGSAIKVGDFLVPATGIHGLGTAKDLALTGLNVLVLPVTPVKDPTDNKGRMGVSISPAVISLQLPPLAAVARGITLTWAWMRAMVGGLLDMFTGRQPLAVAGPVKISEMSRDVSNQGLDKFLLFMALLSINLGIINLLPIPALDGGRLLFILAERVRGRRVEPAHEAVVHLVGFVLVIGLMLVLTAVELFHIGAPSP